MHNSSDWFYTREETLLAREKQFVLREIFAPFFPHTCVKYYALLSATKSIRRSLNSYEVVWVLALHRVIFGEQDVVHHRALLLGKFSTLRFKSLGTL